MEEKILWWAGVAIFWMMVLAFVVMGIRLILDTFLIDSTDVLAAIGYVLRWAVVGIGPLAVFWGMILGVDKLRLGDFAFGLTFFVLAPLFSLTFLWVASSVLGVELHL